MKKKTKTLILSIVVTLILLLTFTITYAVFTYQGTTTNQQLVLGDIYMYYEESDSTIDIDNMMPIDINDYTTYIVNPIMATQTPITYDNELTRCVNYFDEMGLTSSLDEGSTLMTFCQGTGTALQGGTIGMVLGEVSDEDIQEMLSLGIVIQNDESYIPNPVMTSQYVGNELTRCVNYFDEMGLTSSLDEGSTLMTFCQGTGTMNGGTLQQSIDVSISNPEFMTMMGNKLLKEKIMIPRVDLPYFEFTISGKNTYTDKDIYYEILLEHGDGVEDRTTRISDSFLRFRLVEVGDGESETELFTGQKFSSLENKRIWVETIAKNTTDKINKTYRLYMWIANSVVIGNTSDANYSTEEWKNLFASIKVGVKGDFQEKTIEKYPTAESCFTYTIENSGVVITDYNSLCGSDVIIPETIGNYAVTVIGNSAFSGKSLTNVVIPNTVITIEKSAFYDNLLTSVKIPDSVIIIEESAFRINTISKVEIGSNVSYIGDKAFNNGAYATYGASNTQEVTIKGKTSLEDFEYFGDLVFSWGEGYSYDDIVFVSE